jgi:hypothetical protein
MGPVGRTSRGKRAGSRKGARPPRRFRPDIALLALATTLAVVAWGYLVYAAVDFGSDARGGESRAWGFLALAAVGAAACLFVALLLTARVLRALGAPPRPSDQTPAPAQVTPAAPPRHAGGHRAD